MSDKCTFLAIIPNLASAINIHGDGGWRIKLDIPQSEEVHALDLLTMREKVLKVTIEIENGESQRNSTKLHI